MCGRYSITSPPEAVRGLFDYPQQPNFPPRYNIAPTQPVPIVRAGSGVSIGLNKTAIPEFALARWGFVPGWAKEIGSRPLINARSETVAQKPSFRAAFRHRRCLLPANGYYEWLRGQDGPPQPFYISPAKGELMAFAGIWECWSGPDGSEIDTVAILTMAASPDLAGIHHRMPCILGPGSWADWLDCAGTDRTAASGLLVPPVDDFLKTVKVSTAVNRAVSDGPDLQNPVEPEAREPLVDQPRLL